MKTFTGKYKGGDAPCPTSSVTSGSDAEPKSNPSVSALSPDELQEGRRLEAAATPRRWKAERNNGSYKVVWISKREGYSTLELKPNDADLIVFLRNNAAALLSAADALNGMAESLGLADFTNSEMREMLKFAHDAMLNWFSSEYAANPKTQRITEFLARTKPIPRGPSNVVAERDAALVALREAREALERIAKHECDRIYGEYSGRHDPDCRRCIAKAALASLEPKEAR